MSVKCGFIRRPGNTIFAAAPSTSASSSNRDPGETMCKRCKEKFTGRGGNVTSDAIYSRTVLAILTKRLTASSS